MEDMTLESALLAELQKDVKLKNGQVAVDAETGEPLKVFNAIAKSIVNNAMKGDVVAATYLRNLTKKTDAAADEQRQKEARERLNNQIEKMRKELEQQKLYFGQDIELEQIAQNWLIIENLNRQMQQEGYEDMITEMKKDGTMQMKINPLHEWRDKYQKQFLNDWRELRLEALRRGIIKR